MNTGKNIREKQKALGMAWIWHVILILYILFIYFHPTVTGSAVIGGERTGSPAFAEAGSRYRNSRTMADRAYCAQMCSFY